MLIYSDELFSLPLLPFFSFISGNVQYTTNKTIMMATQDTYLRKKSYFLVHYLNMTTFHFTVQHKLIITYFQVS